jgi:outer membrane lipoprotein carrier protein
VTRAARAAAVAYALAVAWCAPAPAAGAAAADPVARLERGLAGTRDVAARLVQVRRSALLEESERATGRLYLRRPGDARFEYDTPEPLVLLKRGDTAYVYVKSLAQVQVMPAAAAGVPMGWVLGSSPAELRRLAEVRAVGDEVELVARRGSGLPWVSLRLGFRAGSDFPVRYRLTDAGGDEVEIRLEAVQRNRGVADERFRPVWPAGTQRVDLGR